MISDHRNSHSWWHPDLHFQELPHSSKCLPIVLFTFSCSWTSMFPYSRSFQVSFLAAQKLGSLFRVHKLLPNAVYPNSRYPLPHFIVVDSSSKGTEKVYRMATKSNCFLQMQLRSIRCMLNDFQKLKTNCLKLITSNPAIGFDFLWVSHNFNKLYHHHCHVHA